VSLAIGECHSLPSREVFRSLADAIDMLPCMESRDLRRWLAFQRLGAIGLAIGGTVLGWRSVELWQVLMVFVVVAVPWGLYFQTSRPRWAAVRDQWRADPSIARRAGREDLFLFIGAVVATDVALAILGVPAGG
jgi:hypothetical protein